MAKQTRITATLEDVAEQAGVSKTTAASILRGATGFRASDETRRRVMEASLSLGYRRNAVATSLSLGRTNTIGVLLPWHHMGIREDTAIARVYGQDVFMAICRAATRAGLRVTPVPPQRDGERIPLQVLGDGRVDGIVAASLNDPEFIAAIEVARIPCVEVGSGTGRHLVHPDNEGGAELAVSHLAGLGHRRIAHWFGYEGSFASERRLAGFLAAAARHGLTDAPVIRSEAGMRALLAKPEGERPTAVFAFHDAFALQVLDLAREMGLCVPEDLSIVGFDNNVLAEAARPPLTTVHNALDGQAEGALEMLQALWRGDEPPARRAVPTRLIVRGTTAPAPERTR